MVTCQSANQLKTPAKSSRAFKIVSQFGSLGYTIMGKTADLTVVQKTNIDTLHKEGKPQTCVTKEAGCSQTAVSKHVNRKLSERKKCGGKRCTTNRENCSLMRIVKQNRFKNLGELHKEWTEAGVEASRATTHRRVKEFGYSCHQRRLKWAKEKKNWTVAQWSKVLFSDESKFCILFGYYKVLESGGRVEKLIAQVAWSQVSSFHSLWWFGVQCHLLVLVHCVFWKPTSLHPFTNKYWSTSCFLLLTSFFKDADFIFQQDLAPAHTAKSTKSWLNDHGVGVLDWSANSPDLNPIKNLWSIVKRKMRNKRPKNADELKATVKETWASIPPQQCHKLITSMPRRIEAVIKAKWVFKGVKQLSTYTVNEHAFQKANNSLKMCFFIGLMKYSNLLR